MVILHIFSDRVGNELPKDELLHITANNKILNITFFLNLQFLGYLFHTYCEKAVDIKCKKHCSKSIISIIIVIAWHEREYKMMQLLGQCMCMSDAFF